MQSARRPGWAILSAALAAAAIGGLAPAGGVPEYHVTRMGDALEVLFPGNQYLLSRVQGLNENGDAVGEVFLDNGQQRAWIYTVEHGVVPLPLLPGWTSSIALDMSDRDAGGEVVIVGSLTVYQEPGNLAVWRFSTVTGTVLETRDVGELPGFTDCVFVSVNNDGIAVG